MVENAPLANPQALQEAEYGFPSYALNIEDMFSANTITA